MTLSTGARSPLIHVLEDDDDIRNVIRYILSDSGYAVQASASAKEFGTKISEQKPDLFLLDVMLPDGDGRDICRELKASSGFNLIPIILISAHANKAQVLLESNADAFISKPFDIEVLVQTIQEILAKRSAN